MPDLSDRLVDFVDGDTEDDPNLIPIRLSTNAVELDTYAIETAQHGIIRSRAYAATNWKRPSR